MVRSLYCVHTLISCKWYNKRQLHLLFRMRYIVCRNFSISVCYCCSCCSCCCVRFFCLFLSFHFAALFALLFCSCTDLMACLFSFDFDIMWCYDGESHWTNNSNALQLQFFFCSVCVFTFRAHKLFTLGFRYTHTRQEQQSEFQLFHRTHKRDNVDLHICYSSSKLRQSPYVLCMENNFRFFSHFMCESRVFVHSPSSTTTPTRNWVGVLCLWHFFFWWA